jgi:hypothetical protein
LETNEILTLIRNLMEEKSKVSKEVEDIQKNCKHKEGNVIKFRACSNEVRRFCKTCDTLIGFPTEKELKDNGFT